ncbi:MAG: msrA [Gammaproteobacteria bacterium]|jgi:peptide-methionine (S)-S-oxide reductase|nr:msrA [Gammaproteobacteria bacterium]
MEKATFAAGCFWGVEAAFAELKGVTKTTVGYEGGHTQNPSYQEVCTDTTGHAEVIEIEFDPTQTSYETLLDTFWQIHDPTTVNSQGPDFGTQYRSVIFYHNEAQKIAAEKSKALAQKEWTHAIVTEIVPTQTFYKAEDYHQQYFRRHPVSCHVPKKK